MLQVQDLKARIDRIETLMCGLSKVYLDALHDAIRGFDDVRNMLAVAVRRLEGQR